MVETAYLLSTALTGLLVLAIGGWLAGTRRRRYDWRAAASADREGWPPGVESGPIRTLSVETGRIASGFVVASAAVAAAVTVYAAGFSTGGGVGASLAVLGVVLIGGYLFAGVYAAGRSRGLRRAMAVATGAWTVGLVVVGVVVVRLIGA